MNIKQLIEELQGLDPSMRVILSEDSEGNGFNELSEVGISMYDGEGIGLIELTAELRGRGFTDEDVMDAEKVVVLWP